MSRPLAHPLAVLPPTLAMLAVLAIASMAVFAVAVTTCLRGTACLLTGASLYYLLRR